MPQPRGKDRTKLEHDPETVDLVRYMFKTYLECTADGPVGVTTLADHLNQRGERIDGKEFSHSRVHDILTNTAYIGYVLYNRRCSRTRELRPETEWIPIPVPPVVSEETFYAVRKQMADRDPKMGVDAEKTNTNLLTKRAVCGCGGDGCGSTMGARTGKSGKHSYYACLGRANKGSTTCPGRWVPRMELDTIVTEAVADHLTQPERLKALLQTWLDRSASAVTERKAELKRLRARVTALDGESALVIKLVRNKTFSPDDPHIASEIANIRAQRISAQADIDVIERQLEAGDRRITPEIVTSFGDLLRRKLRGPDPQARREYVQLLIERVEVGDRAIRITGKNAALERAVIASQNSGAAVPKADRKWCTLVERLRTKFSTF
ncbi:recombinase family protein [Sphingobium sp. HWE2-09]|uniref:recombinase family protein n=1 Tax=Sphingobium sp. HWE2-09 TaxID=3108390 RepID=UPI002DC52E9D|nr:recombinase family protein [Sphingobium sp. HWE2-09]